MCLSLILFELITCLQFSRGWCYSLPHLKAIAYRPSAVHLLQGFCLNPNLFMGRWNHLLMCVSFSWLTESRPPQPQPVSQYPHKSIHLSSSFTASFIPHGHIEPWDNYCFRARHHTPIHPPEQSKAAGRSALNLNEHAWASNVQQHTKHRKAYQGSCLKIWRQ